MRSFLITSTAVLFFSGCAAEHDLSQRRLNHSLHNNVQVRELDPSWVQLGSTPTLQFQGELMVDGEVLDLPRDASRFLGWAPDGQSLLVTRHEVGDLPTESVWRVFVDGGKPWMVRVAPLEPSRFIYSVSLSAGRLLYAQSAGRVITMPGDNQHLELVVADPWTGGVLQRQRLGAGVMPVDLVWQGEGVRFGVDGAAAGAVTANPPPMTELVASLTMPYVHQVYDTPNDFNGNWACGPTSTLMAIGHLGRLSKWPVTVNIPSKHTSNYGAYVAYKYTSNGTTFSRMQKDPSGKASYGGYGWCTENGAAWAWRMQDYAKKHGSSSKPIKSDFYSGKGIADVQKYLNMGRVVVLSTKLTSAGHIVTVKGITSSGKLLVNDPYGDKNQGYKNYKGENAQYTWAQVGTKWFITVYGDVISTDPQYKASLTGTSAPKTMASGTTAKATVTFKNEGAATWNSDTRLATTNPRDRASAFYTKGSWISANRLAACKASTAKGNSETFSFTLTAPKVCKDAEYIEYINLVQEKKAWFSDSGQGGPSDKTVSLKIKVTAVDADGDKHTDCTDCDDKDPAIYPGATEVCNGKDDDCDKQIDEGLSCTPEAGTPDLSAAEQGAPRPEQGGAVNDLGGGVNPSASYLALQGGCSHGQGRAPGWFWAAVLLLVGFRLRLR